MSELLNPRPAHPSVRVHVTSIDPALAARVGAWHITNALYGLANAALLTGGAQQMHACLQMTQNLLKLLLDNTVVGAQHDPILVEEAKDALGALVSILARASNRELNPSEEDSF